MIVYWPQNAHPPFWPQLYIVSILNKIYKYKKFIDIVFLVLFCINEKDEGKKNENKEHKKLSVLVYYNTISVSFIY